VGLSLSAFPGLRFLLPDLVRRTRLLAELAQRAFFLPYAIIAVPEGSVPVPVIAIALQRAAKSASA
jgi:hypothetical protein